MVVDDQLDNKTFLSDILRNVGFEVEACSNGIEAIACFERWKPQVIMMDLEMPEMNGAETIQRIKAMAGGDQVHIIVVTATSFINEKDLLLETGAELYISKPFRMHEIYEAIEKLIDVHYIYEQKTEIHETETTIFLKSDIQRIPAQLIQSIKEAAENAQFDLLMSLIEESSVYHVKLAEYLIKLVNDYQYETLVLLLTRN